MFLSFWGIVGLLVLLVLVQLICNVIGMIIEGALMRKRQQQIIDDTIANIYRKGLGALLNIMQARKEFL